MVDYHFAEVMQHHRIYIKKLNHGSNTHFLGVLTIINDDIKSGNTPVVLQIIAIKQLTSLACYHLQKDYSHSLKAAKFHDEYLFPCDAHTHTYIEST